MTVFVTKILIAVATIVIRNNIEVSSYVQNRLSTAGLHALCETTRTTDAWLSQ